MRRRKETPDKHPKRIRALSAVMIVAMALIVFAGIALSENSNMSIGTETVQNSKSDSQENSIENASFEIKVLQGNERLKLPEKRTVDASHERSKDISLPIVSQNNKGLKVSSFSKNTTTGISGVLNVSRSSVAEGWEPSKHSPSADLLKLGEEVALGNTFTNERSRFAEPNLWVGTGDDPVPDTSKTAYQVAGDYKPMFYLWGSLVDHCPDAVYYRVVKGYDPDAEFDAYLIQYFAYWDCQFCVPGHDYDYEPIFIWVRNSGERPYRVAYDHWDVSNIHTHEIHRTHLWSDLSDGTCEIPEGTHTNDMAYYPFGNTTYDGDGVGDELILHTLPTSLRNNWDGNHVKLGIANCWHTFDTDISGSNCSDYTLSPLMDDELIAAYRLELDGNNSVWCPGGVEAFKYDISDPFHGVFWTDHYHRRHDFPTISAAINSANLTMINGTLSIDTSAYYDNSRAGGSSDKNLTGLWKDRFSAYLEGEGSKIPLEEPFAADEHSAGNYVLKFNNLPLGTYNLSVGVVDNINESEYWAEPENKITNEFKDDFEDTDFSLTVWSPTKGNWKIHTGSNNYLRTTSPAPDSYDPVTQMRGTSNWTDYTVEADIAFMDTGTEGSTAHAYVLGRDSIILSEARPYGGAYIAGVGIENDGRWTGEIFVFRLYDANGDLDIPQDELVRLGRKSLPSDIVSDLVNNYWCHLKVGFEGDRITVYVNSPSTNEYSVLS
ncbi:MAG: hypothetical protein U9N36_07845 [Euryarchaeota archaeon]|nr:hypothetical protein [Euryarchaeota archaeon]